MATQIEEQIGDRKFVGFRELRELFGSEEAETRRHDFKYWNSYAWAEHLILALAHYNKDTLNTAEARHREIKKLEARITNSLPLHQRQAFIAWVDAQSDTEKMIETNTVKDKLEIIQVRNDLLIKINEILNSPAPAYAAKTANDAIER